MADYEMTLTLGNKTIIFPVAPPKLAVKSPGKNETVTVLELGDVNIIRDKGLQEISWDSFFPKNMAPYVTGKTVVDPMTYVKDIEDARDRKKHGRFCLSGDGMNITMQVAVEALEWEERGGEPGDIYYKIKLKEWKDYSATTVSVKAVPKRSGTPAKAEDKTHTVVAGDCLWSIAQEHYGDGSRWPEIYQKNQAVIDAWNKGTGNHKNTIYPKQVLVL